jgi:predicted nuclease of predicted toxin-antitoxin system
LKLLLDANLPPSLATRLSDLGHQADHARERGLGAAPDEAILAHARTRDEVIVTHDLDFGALLAVEGAIKPSVVVLRLRRATVEDLAQRLAAGLPRVRDALEQGAIVTVEDASLRIRKLPVGGGD